MRRSLAALLALCMILMTLCAACGGGKKELPTVTPPPDGENGPAGIAAEDNKAPTKGEHGEEYVSEDHRIAASLVGHDVADLYEAIGKPKRTEYVVGCYENGDDGLLYYDGFYVNTYRYTNGTETVLAAFADE